jgi:hypothetical protein
MAKKKPAMKKPMPPAMKGGKGKPPMMGGKKKGGY